MANIKVNDLQPLEVESMYLTQFEVENVVGGGWFKKLKKFILGSGLLSVGVTIPF
jgi:hypothetical protein